MLIGRKYKTTNIRPIKGLMLIMLLFAEKSIKNNVVESKKARKTSFFGEITLNI